MRKPKKGTVYLIVITAVIVLVALSAFFRAGGGKDTTFVFRDNLDLQIMTVDDTSFTLEDIAFYIAYEEMSVEKDAYVYNPDNTNQYWNVHTNGSFVKAAAKQSVIDMAVHDYIFYEGAIERGLSLDEEDEKTLEFAQTDFFEDY